MILSKTVEIRWNPKIKKRYVQLGYTFTKIGDLFEVSVSDLSSGSNAIVSVQCDYCGTTFSECFYTYSAVHSQIVSKDACIKCRKDKIKETFITKYGVSNIGLNETSKRKSELTNLQRYGAKNVFASEEIKAKIAETNMRKYGSYSPMQNSDVRNKAAQTNLTRYGETSFSKTETFRANHSGIFNPRWKPDKSDTQREEERSAPAYTSWRKAVFDRDKYRCAKCGGRGNRHTGIQAHHIKNWRDFEAVRYDVDNGITLCAQCHSDFHAIYGKRFNSREQLLDFLNNGEKIC